MDLDCRKIYLITPRQGEFKMQIILGKHIMASIYSHYLRIKVTKGNFSQTFAILHIFASTKESGLTTRF